MNKQKSTEQTKKQQKTWIKIIKIVGIVLICLILFALIAFGVLRALGKSGIRKNISGEAPVLESTESTEEGWQDGWIRYNGQIYAYNEDIMTFLVMGVDNDDVVKKAKDGLSGGQADAMFLAVMNPHDKSVSIIAVNRNAMALVDVYDEDGVYMGQYTKQITLQHGYGDGIYNNPEYRQIPDKEKVVSENEKPRLIITEHMDECVEREEAKIAGEVLKLYITNRERFKKINAEDLFRKVENLTDEDGNKLYTMRRKYSVVDVMTASEEENPEALFRFMWILDKILQCYEQKNYGAVIQILRNRDGGKDKFFKTSALDIKIHEDKKKLKETLENINEIYTGNQKKSVLDLLNFLRVKRIIDPMLFSEDMYQDIVSVDVLEFLNLFRAIDAKIISTQHGVKGEGHNNVFFIAEDNSYLNVDMYGFFEMLTKIPVEFQSFQDFYYDYKKKIENLYCVVGKNFLESAQVYKECFPKIKPHIDEINNQLQDNDYYKYIYQDSYKVIEKKGAVLKYMQEFSKTSKIQNILLAYKLFYVGCSRAKKTLTVFVSENQIAHYKEDFRTTFKELGFDISEE